MFICTQMYVCPSVLRARMNAPYTHILFISLNVYIQTMNVYKNVYNYWLFFCRVVPFSVEWDNAVCTCQCVTLWSKTLFMLYACAYTFSTQVSMLYAPDSHIKCIYTHICICLHERESTALMPSSAANVDARNASLMSLSVASVETFTTPLSTELICFVRKHNVCVAVCGKTAYAHNTTRMHTHYIYIYIYIYNVYVPM